MKKILQLVAATVVTLTMGFVPAASAASCTINTTGPNSNNTCTVSGNTTVTVTCVNGVTVTNLNNQTALSGPATVSGNTVSGNATSGDASNLNAAATQLAQNCASAPATTTTTPAPATPAGGQGGGSVAAAQTTAPNKIATLPNTGPSTIETSFAIGAIVTGLLAAAAHFGLSIYRRRAFKV